MDEKCTNCRQPLKKYRACLKCHCSYCYYCEDNHIRNNSGHSFRLPPLNTNCSYTLTSKCTHVNKDYNQFCQDCNELVCGTCLTLVDLHKGHRTRLIDQLAYEQKQEVASEIEMIVKSNRKVQTQLDARERHLAQLIKKANEIDFDLDQEFKRIKALLLGKSLNSKSFFESPQGEDLCAFLSEIKSLKAAIKIDKELEKTLENLLKETRTNETAFLTGYADFRKHSAMLVTYPKAVADEFLSMEIDYQKLTDEEMKNVLPRICIGSASDISRARRKLEEENATRKVDSTRNQKDIREKDKQITDLQDKLRYEDICKQHETMKRELKRSEEDKENLMTRLNQVAGAKLTAGNSSIAELGDKYRPTRISEMFAEIYDSDWTDVMDTILESHKEWTEECVVRHTFIVLQECFHACKRIATEQMKRLCEDMFLSASTQDLSNYVETHVTEIKQLQDARKRTAPFVGKMLTERVLGDSTLRQNCRRNKGINMPLVSQITASKFGQQCVNICWFMVVQDPEMYIDGGLQPGIQFDREVYKEYTGSGKRVAFSVWPALYLHEDGPLLTKGVAQACD